MECKGKRDKADEKRREGGQRKRKTEGTANKGKGRRGARGRQEGRETGGGAISERGRRDRGNERRGEGAERRGEGRGAVRGRLGRGERRRETLAGDEHVPEATAEVKDEMSGGRWKLCRLPLSSGPQHPP